MASTGDTWRLGRRPALDGLRAVAVGLVILEHTEVPGFDRGGAVGVTMFFTLSGFLITTLLLEERGDRGHVSLKAFYLRRALRLLPALYLCLGVTVTAAAVLGIVSGSGSFFVSGSGPFLASVLLYASNWMMAHGPQGMLGHTWSLSIEEQFYATWPLVVLVLPRARWLLWAAVMGAAGSFALRMLLWNDGLEWRRVWFGTDTRADALLIGCALACIMHGRAAGGRSSTHLVTALAAAAVAASSIGDGAGLRVFLPLIVAAGTAAAIFCLVGGDSRSWLQWRPLALVGRRSYALYLWHYPFMVAVVKLSQGRVAWPVLLVSTAVFSMVAATVSWHLVEAPCLRLKGRWERRGYTASSPPVTVR